MKTFATAAVGALCIASTDARQMHGHSHPHALKRVQQTKQHLEMVYGKGLTGLYNDYGELDITPQRMKAARRRPAQDYMKIGGIMMDQEVAITGLYGFVEGFQYTGLASAADNLLASEMVESNCFYSMYGLVDSVDVLVNDFSNIVDPAGELKWVNLILYNPSHIVNNFMVGYEMCEVYTQVERLMGLFSLDWALLAQSIGTDLVYLLGESAGDFEAIAAEMMPCLQNAVQVGLDLAGEAATDAAEEAMSGVTQFTSQEEYMEMFLDDPSCQPNFYAAGKITGEIMSRLLMQKLEESRLP